MTAADFDFVKAFIREEAAIVVGAGKEYLVETRLQALATREQFPSVSELVAKLRTNRKSELQGKVVDALTTNETSFFRDFHPFEAIKKSILPELANRRGAERQLNLWCAAASTGQETFSVLMTIAEHFPELLKWNLRFLATDICQRVLERCRAGRFSQFEVNRGLPASLLVKYFSKQNGEWEFREALRKRVEFRAMNLIREWSRMPPMDLILLRNVLIYFDLETKKSILAKVRRILRPGGFLLLGATETTLNLDDAFERVVLERVTYYRIKPA